MSAGSTDGIEGKTYQAQDSGDARPETVSTQDEVYISVIRTLATNEEPLETHRIPGY